MRRGIILGLTLSALVALAAAYEFLALATALPTISRIWQGFRDTSEIAADLLAIAAAVISLMIVGFAFWLWRHLRYDLRSELLRHRHHVIDCPACAQIYEDARG